MAGFGVREVGGSGGVVVVAFGDDFSRQRFIDLEKHVAELVRSGKCRLALDMSRLPMISSDGIGLLVPMHDRCEQAGGIFTVFGLNEKAARVIKLASLEGFFNIFPSEKEAVAAAAPPAPEPEPAAEPAPEPAPAPAPKPAERPAPRAAAKPAPEPAAKPEAKPAPRKPRSARMVAPPRSDADEKRMRELIHTLVKSRLHALVLERAAGTGSASLKGMAKDLGSSPANLKLPIGDLTGAGVLKVGAEGDFTFAPTGNVKEDVEFFLGAWSDANRRSRIAAWLLAEEKTG